MYKSKINVGDIVKYQTPDICAVGIVDNKYTKTVIACNDKAKVKITVYRVDLIGAKCYFFEDDFGFFIYPPSTEHQVYVKLTKRVRKRAGHIARVLGTRDGHINPEVEFFWVNEDQNKNTIVRLRRGIVRNDECWMTESHNKPGDVFDTDVWCVQNNCMFTDHDLIEHI